MEDKDIKRLIKELKSMPKKKAPKGFLDGVHQRINKPPRGETIRSFFTRFYNSLFEKKVLVPAGALAGLASLVLVTMVLRVSYDTIEKQSVVRDNRQEILDIAMADRESTEDDIMTLDKAPKKRQIEKTIKTADSFDIEENKAIETKKKAESPAEGYVSREETDKKNLGKGDVATVSSLFGGSAAGADMDMYDEVPAPVLAEEEKEMREAQIQRMDSGRDRMKKQAEEKGEAMKMAKRKSVVAEKAELQLSIPQASNLIKLGYVYSTETVGAAKDSAAAHPLTSLSNQVKAAGGKIKTLKYNRPRGIRLYTISMPKAKYAGFIKKLKEKKFKIMAGLKDTTKLSDPFELMVSIKMPVSQPDAAADEAGE